MEYLYYGSQNIWQGQEKARTDGLLYKERRQASSSMVYAHLHLPMPCLHSPFCPHYIWYIFYLFFLHQEGSYTKWFKRQTQNPVSLDKLRHISKNPFISFTFSDHFIMVRMVCPGNTGCDKVGIDPRCDPSPIQGTMHIYIHSFTPERQVILANLSTSVFLWDGRKQGNREETHMDTERTRNTKDPEKLMWQCDPLCHSLGTQKSK